MGKTTEDSSSVAISAFKNIFSSSDALVPSQKPFKTSHRPYETSMKYDALSNEHQKDILRENTYNENMFQAQATHITNYQPLLDRHLYDYFDSESARKHLTRLGLIDDQGHIIGEQELKHVQILMDKRAQMEQIKRNILERQVMYAIHVINLTDCRRESTYGHNQKKRTRCLHW